MKNINAPNKAPEILKNVVWYKYLDIKPIINTLPHVKKVVLWKPIKISVIKKHKITTNIYLESQLFWNQV